MDPVALLKKLSTDAAIPDLKQEVLAELALLQSKEDQKKAFIIERLREDKKITENFLNKTVEELENKNHELSALVAEREKSNEQLVEINKELEQFAYIISHDLQEPLRNIISFVGLLYKRKSDQLDEQAKVYLDFISRSTYRMSRQIKAILEYSRIGKNGPVLQIDCNELLKEVLTDLTSQIDLKKANIKIGKLPMVQGVKIEIQSLFQNLISNALKYTQAEKSAKIEIESKDQGTNWLFSIKDNGIGFRPDYKEQIFEIFQRLNPNEDQQGSGIGLAQCKKIVELHSGKIWAESVLKKGSTFYFTLPKMD